MKTRDAKYADYWISREQVKKTIDFCRNVKNEYEKKIVRESVIWANPEIHEQIYDSLVFGMSYEKLRDKKYIPIDKKDFYGYRRKAIWKLEGFLRMHGY